MQTWTAVVPRRLRRRFLVKPVAKWLVPAWRCMALPVADKRKRFFVALWVFILVLAFALVMTKRDRKVRDGLLGGKHELHRVLQITRRNHPPPANVRRRRVSNYIGTFCPVEAHWRPNLSFFSTHQRITGSFSPLPPFFANTVSRIRSASSEACYP